MEELRLGRPVSIFETDEDNAGDIYLNKQTALKQDVLQEKPKAFQTSSASVAQQPVAQAPAVKQPEMPSASAWLRPSANTAPSTQTQESQSGGAPADQMPTASAWLRPQTTETAPVAEKPQSGAFVRGASEGGWGSAKSTAVGGAALLADTVGAKDTANSFFKKYETLQNEKQKEAKPYESFSNVTDGKASFGDFLGYWGGYAIGQVAQTVAAAGVGAAAGSVVPGAGTAAGAISGVLERGVAQEGIKKLVETKLKGMVETHLAENLAKKMGAAEAEKLAYNQAARSVFRQLGAAAAVTGQNVMMEGSSIYGDARGDAEKEGKAVDLGRVWTGTVLAAATESAMDLVGANAIVKAAGGGHLFRNILRESYKGGLREGSTEAVQTGFERFGAGKDLATAEAVHDYIDSAAAGAVGGVMFGTAKGSMQSARGARDDKGDQTQGDQKVSLKDKVDQFADAASTPEGRDQLFADMQQNKQVAAALSAAGIKSSQDPKFQSVLDDAIRTSMMGTTEEQTHQTNSAGFVAEPKEQLQAQVAAVVDGRKPAAVMGVEEAAGIDAAGLFKHEVTDKATGLKSVVISKDEGMGQKVQARADEVGLKQAMGETLGYVEPENTTDGNKDAVVVQQVDDKSGQVITEQAVSPENVNKVPHVDGTTTSVQSVDGAINERKQGTESQQAAPAGADMSAVDAAAHEAATSPMNEKPLPTDEQKKSGNYAKGHVKLHGLDITVENPEGSERSGMSPEGKPWSQTMANHYGYVKGTVGNDKDHVDVFIGPAHESTKVFVVDQKNEDGSFDEHKAMLGFNTEEEARAAYHANYEAGWTGMGAISEMPVQAFKSWVNDGKKGKPLAYAAPVVAKAAPVVETKTTNKQEVKNEQSVQADSKAAKDESPKGKTAKVAPAKAGKATESGEQAAPAKAAKVSKPAAPEKSEAQIEQEAVELWEDNDDGSVSHIPFFRLPKATQNDWINAYAPEDGEKPFASAEYHDELVKRVLRVARTERINKVASVNRKKADPDGVYRVSTVGNDTGMEKDAVQKIVDSMVKDWVNLPPVNVVATEDDLPIKALTKIKKADMAGRVSGMFYNNKVWLVAGNLNNKEHVVLTTAHEIAGHFGLRSILGEKHASVMMGIYKGNRTIRKAADAMAAKERLPIEIAVEEVLVDLSEKDEKLKPDEQSALRTIYNAIRAWLRDTFGIAHATNAEINELIANARNYVIEGKGEEGKGGTAAAEKSVEGSIAARAKAPTFYSALENAFRGSKQGAMPADQWKAWLASKGPSLGVRKEEVKWVGVNEWLDMQSGKVTKEQVLTFIGGNKLRLNDVFLKSGMSDEELAELVDQLDEDSSAMTRDEMLDVVTHHYGWKADRLGLARHRKYTEEGGDDYVELILTDPTVASYKQGDKTHFGDVSEGKAIGWLRMITRSDSRGDPVLFLEEIQSQRGQDGRESMFFDGNEEARNKEIKNLQLKIEMQDERAVDAKTKEEADKHNARIKELTAQIEKLRNAVPDAPFVKDTKAWTALLLKRAIAYAQEQGISKVAWTHGEQQVERYRLSKSIDDLTISKNDDGTFTVIGEKDGKKVINQEKITEKKLAGTVGKDMAAQAVANGGNLKLSGTDMDIGGDGVAHYYNSTVPSVAKEVIKNFDGKVEVMTIESTGEQLGFTITEKLQKQVAEDGLPVFSLKEYQEQFSDLPADVQQMAIAKGHASPPTIKQRFEALKPNFWRRTVQGTFDKFDAIKGIDWKAYMMARMSNGPQDGAISTLLHYGQVVNDGGALNHKKGTKGLLEILKDVGPEVDRYLLWVAANRADNLAKEDKERFFSPDEIKALKKINLGTTKDGKSRAALYIKTLQEMSELNRSVLDVAKSAGLINDAAYKKFAADIWYIPFYREMGNDRSLSGAQTSSALVGQELSKKLKGSSRGLNDLMENVLMNWSHILSASMKNQAAVETLGAADRMGGIVTKLTKVDSTMGKDAQGNAVPLKFAVKVMDKGETSYYRVDDEFLFISLDSITTMTGSNPFLDIAGEFKTTLTRFVSLSPTFKINNLIRDSIQSVALSGTGNNPLANAFNGMKLYKDDRASALAAGGLFAMGNAFDGDQSSIIKRVLKSGARQADVLTTAEQAKHWFGKMQDKYDEVSDAMENANRIALYEAQRASGATHLEASYAARDLQDFSLQGSWGAIRYASKILPYFNARLQGLYKMGRDGIDPVRSVLFGNATDTEKQKAAKFATVVAAVTMVELALYLSQKDDDDWKKREEWDKDGFYWFKIPGTTNAVRIPKPFEIGAIGTLFGRATEQMVDSNVEGKLFAQRFAALIHDNFAINPIPQIFRPSYDVARNKDGFTDRPIESMGMERLSKQNRINPGTSPVAVGIAKMNQVVAEGVGKLTGSDGQSMQLSPIQVDYMLRGYLGWMGTVMQSTSREIMQPLKDGAMPDRRVDDLFVIGNFVKTTPQSQSKYITSFYQNASEVQTVVSDYNAFKNMGQTEQAIKTVENNRDKFLLKDLYSHGTQQLAEISHRIKVIEDDKHLSGEQKRADIDRMNALRSDIAKQVEEIRVKRTRGN